MKPNTTKVIIILFLIFVPSVYSQIPSAITSFPPGISSLPSGISTPLPPGISSSTASFYKELKNVILFIFCQIGQIIAAASGGVTAVCSSLPTDGDLANEMAVFVCNNTGLTLDAVSGVFIQFCPNSDKKTDPGKDILKTLDSALNDLNDLGPVMDAMDALKPALAILSTSNPAISILSTSSPALDVLSALDPALAILSPSTSAPTTSTPTPTTLSTSTQEPTTTTQRITTPAPTCTGEQTDRCNDRCAGKSNFNLTLGGKCTARQYRNSHPTIQCGCKQVQHCDTYTNSTCEQKCKRYGPDAEYCRIQEANLPCVCKFHSGNDLFYRKQN